MLLQSVLETPRFHDSSGPDERHALTPLFWTYINPYGRFRLDMNKHLDLTASETIGADGGRRDATADTGAAAYAPVCAC